MKLCALFLALCACVEVRGHGYLQKPAARNSMWRFGFNTPPNYSDNDLNCGGFGTQWNTNGGRCGFCGDAYNAARPHEAGGTYANGIITGTYRAGQTIDIEINLMANHIGYFQFKLCPNNNPGQVVTQQCLDRYQLKFSDGTEKWMIGSARGILRNKLRLPAGVTCSQCVLQWFYNTGNSWGTDPDGTGCLGCGKQEQYYNCADIAITGDGAPIPTEAPTPAPDTPEPTNAPPTHAPQPTTTTSPPAPGSCRATGVWEGDAGMDAWCDENCPINCPDSHCSCQ